MPANETTYLERLRRIEGRLFAKLSSIQANRVECDGIVWVPPGWGMDYWAKGLRFQQGSEAIRYNKLSPEGLAQMISNLGKFSEHVRAQYGLDIEPPPKPPGPGFGHWIKMATSPAYRDEIRQREQLAQITEGREKLQTKRDAAAETRRTLEAEEADLLRRGKEASEPVRRRLAGDVLQLRKKIARQTTVVRFIDAKLEACEVALHNRTLTELARIGPVTDAETMADIQIAAEDAARDTQAALDAATAVDFDASSAEGEAAILREMESASKEPDSTTAEAAIMQEMEEPADDESANGTKAAEGISS